MIVCVCGNVSSKQIDEAIKSGHDTLEDLQIELGVCCQCCRCKEFLEQKLAERKEES